MQNDLHHVTSKRQGTTLTRSIEQAAGSLFNHTVEDKSYLPKSEKFSLFNYGLVGFDVLLRQMDQVALEGSL